MSLLTNLQPLRSFVAVMRTGAVRRAAHWLHYSPSTIRAHVRDLEQQLGVRLVDRHRPDRLLTPEAEELAPKIVQAEQSVTDLEQQAARTGERSRSDLPTP